MNAFKTDAPVIRTFTEYLPEPFIDTVSDTEKYYGWAPLGVSEDEPRWKIVKEVKEGTVTKKLYAQGTMEFAFAWSKRKEYKYSR